MLARSGRACGVIVLTLAVALIVTTSPAEAARRQAPVAVTGRVVDQAGHPMVGVPVSVRSDALLDAPGLVGAIFLITCVFVPVPDVCFGQTVRAVTDRQGRYRLRIRPGTALARATLLHLDVRGRAPASGLLGAWTQRPLSFHDQNLAVNDTVLWQPDLTLHRSGGRARLTLSQLPGAKGRPGVRFDDKDGRAWTAYADAEGTVEVDEHVLEQGTLTVAAEASGPAVSYASWQAKSFDVGRPVSRGLACATYLTDDTLATLKACPYTDGRLSVRPGLTEALRITPGNACHYSCPHPNTLVLNLGREHVLDALVLRGCTGCTVELSAGANVWTPWPHATTERSGGDAIVTGPAFVTRQVRVAGDVFLLWDLQEVSVFASPLPLPLVSPLAAPAPHPPVASLQVGPLSDLRGADVAAALRQALLGTPAASAAG